MQFYRYIPIITLVLSFQVKAISDYGMDLNPDHAHLDSRHENRVERFVDKKLKTDGKYDSLKIQSFIERLELEKKSLISDLAETDLMESIEIYNEEFLEANKSANKILEDSSKSSAIAYDKYLIPKLNLLLKKLEDGASAEILDAIVDQFIIVYGSFYQMERPRNAIRYDNDLAWKFKHLWRGFNFKKGRDTKKIEANNLMVEDSNLIQIKNILGGDLSVGHILTNDEIEVLLDHEYDISKINPAKSPLWRNLNQNSFLEAKNLNKEWFPQEGEKVYFNKVKAGGIGTGKIGVYIKRKLPSGEIKKIKYKVKVGRETQGTLAATAISKMLGFHQDPILYKAKIKLYLEDTSYEEFVAKYNKIYGGDNLIHRYVEDHGGNKGEEWVIIKDSILEISNPEKVKVGPFGPFSLDFPNRREHRARILFYSFLGIHDVNAKNHRLNLVKSTEGYKPELSLQDLGAAFDAEPVVFHDFKSFFKNRIYHSYTPSPNLFSETFLKDKPNSIRILWTEAHFYIYKEFNTTTYFDLKWFARKIAALTEEDFKYAFSTTGLHHDVQDLFIKKLLIRRNELIKCFELENEFALVNVPKLSTYSPNENIKNGNLVESSNFGGARAIGKNNNILADILVGFLPQVIGTVGNYLSLGDVEKRLFNQISASVAPGSLGYNGNPSGEFLPNLENQHFSSAINSSGIRLELQRFVGSNYLHKTRDNATNRFFVRDHLAIEIDLGYFFSGTLPVLPYFVHGNVKLWRFEFDLIQMQDTLKKAYFAPIKIFKALRDHKKFALEGLAPQEVLKLSNSFGISIGAGANLTGIPFAGPSVSTGVRWNHARPVYFYRDSLDNLNVFREKMHSLGLDLNLTGMGLDILGVDIPVLGIGFTMEKSLSKSQLYSFKIPYLKTEYTTSEKAVLENEISSFHKLLKERKSSPETLAHKKMDLEVNGFSKNFSTKFGFIFRFNKSSGYFKTKIKFAKEDERIFHRYNIERTYKKNLKIIPEIPFVDLIAPISGYTSEFNQALIFGQDRTVIDIELDEKNLENITGEIIIEKFERKLSRLELDNFLDEENFKYSITTESPFYREYFLPPVDEVDTYRKIFSRTRVYIDFNKLFKKLPNIDLDKAQKELSEFRTKVKFGSVTGKPSPIDGSFRAKFMSKGIIKALEKLKKIKNDPKKVVKALAQLIDSTKVHTFGLGPLKGILGTDALFVTGNIYGILPSYSDSQTQAERAIDRRFMGKSWGQYVMPPIRRYMKTKLVTSESQFVILGVKEADFLGNPLPDTMTMLH